MIDIELKEQDLQNLSDPHAIAEFFTKLQYNTSERLTQSPAHLGIAESLHPDIKKCERIADQEGFLQVYLFELRSVTVAATKTIARALKNKVGNYLLVLTSDYERIDFVLLERIQPEHQKKARPTPTLAQANVRPRLLTVNRRKPTRVDLRVLRRFIYTESDAFAQYDKLVSAFNIADWSEDEFNNRALFSDYYLKERLTSEREWREDPKPCFLKLSDLFENAREKWSNKSEKELRAGMLEPAFEVLGFSLRAGKKAGDDKAEPDYFLFGSGTNSDVKNALALCLAYPWDRYLDGKDYTRDAESPEENPGQLVLSLLQREEADWAIVTNGKVWRLYSAKTHSRASNYYEVDLDEVLRERDPEMFRYFWLLFRAQAFAKRKVTVKGEERETTFVEQLLEGSRQYAKELGERLKERVFNNIFPHFAKGFIEYRRGLPGIGEQDQKQLFDDSGQLLLKAEAGEKYLDDIYQTTLTFLYRLLFLLYSESRDLLPVKEERGYWEKSLTRLKNEVAEAGGPEEEGRKKSLEKHYSKTSTQLYDRLLALFRIIDKGQASINVPRYNGGLFITEPGSDDASDEARHAKLLNENKIPNTYLALGLDALARDEDNRTFKLVPIDYKSLGVRHLGSIYEGLLEFRVRIAPEKMAICRGKGKAEVILPYAETKKKKGTKILTEGRGKSAVERTWPKGAVYLENDKHERKATGSYYTPDHIVKYIVENTGGPVLQEKFDTLTPKFREAQKHHRKQQKYTEQKARLSNFPMPEKTLQAVLNTYRPLLNELFDVKVLDPAMGSGHFLVEAVDFITDRLIDFLNGFPWNPVLVLLEEMRETIFSQMNEQGIAIDRGKLTDVNLLKRHVLKRCIYGVDLNPMAVELAKVSLWLDCFTLGAPLSFLDHHLKCGNSLIGTRIDTVKKEVEKDLFGGQFAGLLQATQSMIHVGELSDVTPEQVKESRNSFLNASQILEPFKEVLDLWTSQYFGNKDARNLFLTAGFPEIRRGWQKELGDKARAAVSTGHEAVQEKRFFHWELEFPEVFFEKGREKDNPGFDAVVGNPPYQLLQGTEYQASLKAIDSDIFSGSNDISHFFLKRACQLLLQGGMTCFIVTRYWLEAHFAAGLRYFLATHGVLKSIVDFGNIQVWPDVNILTVIPLFERSKGCSETTVYIAPEPPNLTASQFLLKAEDNSEYCYKVSSKLMDRTPWRFRALDKLDLWEKIRNQSICLGQITTNTQGVKSGSNQVFTVSESLSLRMHLEKDWLVPLAQAETIQRYELKDLKEWLIYTDGTRSVDLAPNIRKYLSEFKRELSQRAECNKNLYPWWRLQRPRDPKIVMAARRLLVPLYSTMNRFLAVETTVVGMTDVYIVVPTDESVAIYFLSAVLNSYLLTEYHKAFCKVKRAGYLEYSGNAISKLPIRRISFTTPPERRKALAEQARTLYEQHIWSAATVSPSEVTQSLHSKREAQSPAGASPHESTQSTHSKTEILEFVQEHLTHDPERSDVVHDLLAFLAEEMIRLNKEKQAESKRFLGWLEEKTKMQDGIESLAGKIKVKNYLGDYQKNEREAEFETILTVLQKNKRKLGASVSDRKLVAELEKQYEASLAKLLPIKQKLALTDRLIDQIVYKLYGLTEEEIAIVENV